MGRRVPSAPFWLSHASSPVLRLSLRRLGWRRREPASGSVRLIFAGDIMLDMLPGAAARSAASTRSRPFAKVFSEADFVVGNLECVVNNRGRQFIKPFTFKAHPRVVPVLDRYFDALTIANNHTGDFGTKACSMNWNSFGEKSPSLRRNRPRRSPQASDCRSEWRSFRPPGLQRIHPERIRRGGTGPHALRGAWTITSWPISGPRAKFTRPMW